MTLNGIAALFPIDSEPVSSSPLGNGHINETYLITCASGSKFVLQKINRRIFTDVDGLMRNIRIVTQYLNALKPHSSLEFLSANDGRDYAAAGDGYYRMYRYVYGISLETARTPAELETCGKAFGEFQTQLADFDAEQLTETIPRFHDTVKRLHDLERAASQDEAGRFKQVEREFRFYMQRQDEAGVMLGLLAEGRLKKRVTHNDTKLNNVLLDEKTLTPLCVIDLDTVMPGLPGNDFGDCIRTGASTAAEDEPDLDKVWLDLEKYRAFARGFLSECGRSLNKDELSTLTLGAKLMTYECGMRFLTDYLNGDTYFRTAYPEHNLVRCRTQMKLISDTEAHMSELNKLVAEEAER